MTLEVVAWIVGPAVVVGIGLWPLLRPRKKSVVEQGSRDGADALISQLNFEIDHLDPTISAKARRRAEQCALMAGAALAGTPTPAAWRRSEQWSRSGLKALGK